MSQGSVGAVFCRTEASRSMRIAPSVWCDSPAGMPSTGHLLGYPHPRVLLQLAGVSVELPDTLGQLVGGHGILIVHPAKRLFVQVDLLRIGRFRRLHAQAAGD